MSIKPLSSDDITTYMNGDCTIMKYMELSKYRNINDIFWGSRYVFLLYPISSNYGHWVLISKLNNNIIEVFDSYGIFIDNEYKYGTQKVPKYLSDLMIKSPKNIKLFYNEIQFQKFDTEYCGYHCVCRAYYSSITLKKYQSLLKNQNNPDNFVYKFVMKL